LQALQGVFTLDLQPSLKVMLHFGGAMIFMWGGMTHAQTIEPVYAAAATAEGCMLFSHAPVVAAAAFRRVAITGALPVVGFVLPLGFQVVQFVYGGSSEDTAQESEKAVSSGEASGKQEDETDKEGKGQVAKQKEDAAGPQEVRAVLSCAKQASKRAKQASQAISISLVAAMHVLYACGVCAEQCRSEQCHGCHAVGNCCPLRSVLRQLWSRSLLCG
jgi:hypothetical protein